MGALMVGLNPETYDRSYKDSQLIRRIIGYFRPQFRLLIIVMTLIVLNALLDIVSPILISRTLDTLVISRAMQTIVLLVCVILLSSVLSWTCNLFRQWFATRAVSHAVLQLRKDAFAAVMSQDMSFFDKFSSGSIISRVTSDTESFASVVMLTLNLLTQILLFFMVACVLVFINWHLALLTFTILPTIVLVTLGFRILARQSTRQAQRSLARVNANVQEVVRGITVAKNFRQEQSMYNGFKHINSQSYHVNLRVSFLFSSIYPVFGIIANIGTTIVIYFGGLRVLDHTISLGSWFLFVQCIGLLWNPLTSIASFWSQFQLGLSASERVFALLDREAQVQQIDQQSISNLSGKIEFKNVHFSYNDRETVLPCFNLTINPGETVAFVGHTGAGKTTLGRLIARFYEFQGGQILIDDHDIRTLNLHDYRSHLGIVPQVPFLFSGTVTDNIRYAKPEASIEEIAAIAQQIGGGDWLKTLSDGLQTQVGESGKILSIGQKQIVVLARVLLQNPSVVILDEATASIDPLTEAQIQEGLNVMLKGRTAIIIAHRLSTIRHADRIIVLHRGRIVEEGNHKELIDRGGYYAHLYNIYFRHQSPDYQPGEGYLPVLLPIEEKLEYKE